MDYFLSVEATILIILFLTILLHFIYIFKGLLTAYSPFCKNKVIFLFQLCGLVFERKDTGLNIPVCFPILLPSVYYSLLFRGQRGPKHQVHETF